MREGEARAWRLGGLKSPIALKESRHLRMLQLSGASVAQIPPESLPEQQLTCNDKHCKRLTVYTLQPLMIYIA